LLYISVMILPWTGFLGLCHIAKLGVRSCARTLSS
jgi:hypothetical protein